MGQYSQARIFEQRFEKMTRRFTAGSLALAYKVYFKLGERRIAKNYGTMLVKMFPQSWEAKQYLLNDLAEIEADQLAKRFKQTSSQQALASKNKKRVIVLSPKKQAVSKKATAQIVLAKQEKTKQDVAKLDTTKQEITKSETVKQTLIKKAPAKQLPLKPLSEKTLHSQENDHQEQAYKESDNKEVAEQTVAEIEKTKTDPAIHIVVEGDTLYGISMKYNLKMSSLRRWNGLKKSERLYVGNVLLLIDPKTMQKN
jgi:type IV pilus assembly protein PilF